eukprot:s3945_g8.t1
MEEQASRGSSGRPRSQAGPGKRNKVLPFMVSNKVSVTGVPWLKTGMQILEDRYWYPPGYLVPVYPEGLEDLAEKRPATYDDFVAMTRLVYSKLRECNFTQGHWASGKSPLLLPDLYGLRADREWDLRNAGLEEVKEFIEEIKYDQYSIERQMEKYARGLDADRTQ